jgi:alpha-L-rhamnosidase
MRVIILFVLLAVCAAAQAPDVLRHSFENPPADARIMMRWWWFGPAVTDAELEREMVAMKRGGIGGFEIQPVYPVMMDDPAYGIKTLPYLSNEYLDRLRFVGAKAAELGLRLNITLGSGWPFGGPHVPVYEAAGKIRIEHVPVAEGSRSVAMPDISSGERLEAIFVADGNKTSFAAGTLRQVPNTMAKRVDLPEGGKEQRVLLVFISSRTGQQVKRAAVGAEGFVLDHYDRRAIDHHLNLVADKLIAALGAHPPYSVFSDSLEVYGNDWTPDLLSEFKKRRGYDLTPYLPALAGDIGEKTEAIRHDWGMTLTELSEDNYLTPLTNWAKLHGTKFRSQTYGIPPVRLSSNALVDLPEGEGFQWRRFSTSRWASSASHLYGRPVTSSETWTWLHSPVFAATPLDMKAEADLHFLQGINQLVGHGWPYSPPQVGEPGWRFYAAAVFNDHNPWYMVMPDIAKYLQRVSYLLRQGKPENDVALYLPTDDAWAHFMPGRDSVSQAMEGLLGEGMVARILDAGFNLDFIDDLAIEKMGVQHPVLILPNVDRIAVASYERIEAFAKKGGVVLAVGRLPSLAPGLQDAGMSGRVKEISARLFTGAGAAGHVAGEQDLAKFFTPDVRMEPKTPEIGFVHRKLDAADVYFLANTGNQARRVAATFRVSGRGAQWWDPFSGKVSAAEVAAADGKTSTVALEMAPYESRVLVFAGTQGKVISRGPVTGTIDASAGWQVAFPDGKTVTMEKLRSWTDDEATRYFSGTATYTKTVTVQAGFLSAAGEVRLDFGQGTPVPAARGANARFRAAMDGPVREAAIVTVNGKTAGSVWKPPYAVEVKHLLHEGSNEIQVVVGNLAVNTMVGQAAPNYKLLNLRYTERFTPQDVESMQPVAAGMLGTVTLVGVK